MSTTQRCKGPKSKSTPRERRGSTKHGGITGDSEGEEAEQSGSGAAASTTHDSTPGLMSTRGSTRAHPPTMRQLQPRPNAAAGPSQPSRVEVRSPPPRTISKAWRPAARPYPDPHAPRREQSRKAPSRGKPSLKNGRDAVDEGLQPSAANLPGAGSKQASSEPRVIPRRHRAFRSPSLPPSSSSTPFLDLSTPPSPIRTPSPPTDLPATAARSELRLAPTPNTVVAGTSYFPYSKNVTIRSLTTNPGSAPGPSRVLFDLLNPHISHGAAHDSNERCDAPTCHKKTRVAVRQDIVSWIKHGEGGDEPKRVMWLSGPAGAGKTAIAGSVAEECKKEGLLAATFMFSSFSGSADRMSKRCLITTLAYHISQHESLHHFQAYLLGALERRPDIFNKNLKEQAECLIIGPFQLIDRENRTGWPKVIIIDGLDEVVVAQHHDLMGWQVPRTSEEDQVEVLDTLLTLCQSPCFPFRLVISSRPESNIKTFFTTAAKAYTTKLFLDSKYNPDIDIERFLKSKFARIRRDSGISDALWPGQPALDRLVDMSSGQFIVPTTIIRWIDAGLPQEQLDEVLRVQRETAGSRNPFASLDALYSHILKRARNPDSDPRLVVKWVVSTYSAHVGITPPARFWRQLFEDWEGELNYRMAPVTSLISIPPPNDTGSCITFYHKSLTDFLSTEARCGADLYVDDMALNSFITHRILGVLKNKGPCVPHSLSDVDLRRFLRDFIMLNMVIEWDNDMFLSHLDGTADAGATLASCDVARWTSAILHQDLQPLGLHHLSEMYCKIHKAMKCPVATGSSTQHVIHEGQDTTCHAACIHWRRGILANAKELGWCVHELEELELDDLGSISGLQAEGIMFKRMGQRDDGSFRRCSICQPVSSSLK